jgi:hypothetical protein
VQLKPPRLLLDVDLRASFGRVGRARVHAFLHRESFGATDLNAISLEHVSIVPCCATSFIG